MQVPFAKESQYLTAFITANAVYRFKRVCFDLASAPATLQKIIAEILHCISGCFNLLNDGIVHGFTIAEHDKQLHAVLEICMEQGVSLQQVKCLLGQTENEFNDHMISGQCIKPLAYNVEVSMNAKRPQNIK